MYCVLCQVLVDCEICSYHRQRLTLTKYQVTDIYLLIDSSMVIEIDLKIA